MMNYKFQYKNEQKIQDKNTQKLWLGLKVATDVLQVVRLALDGKHGRMMQKPVIDRVGN